MQVRSYLYPFHTSGVDYLATYPSGNKWILTAVCPFSKYLISVPVPDKTATMVAQVLFHHVFLKFGFPAVLQSDRGGEFLNAVLHRITKLLSIKHIFTWSYRPRLNGATERVHHWLNAAIVIFCERHQSDCESYLQPATYSNNASPIQGTKDLDLFFLNFGRHALPPEVISLQLPPHLTSSDTYAQHLVQHLATAHKQFQAIKSDLRRSQREYYDSKSRTITIPPEKQVYMRKHFIGQKPLATRFICNFDGSFTVIRSYNQRNDLLKLRAINGDILLPVNVEKLVVVPDDNESNIRPDDLAIDYEDIEPETATGIPPNRQNQDLQTIAPHFAKYLLSCTNNKVFTSQACKHVYISSISHSTGNSESLRKTQRTYLAVSLSFDARHCSRWHLHN